MNEAIDGIHRPAQRVVLREEDEQQLKRWFQEDQDEWAREKKWFTINDLLKEKDEEPFWLWEGYLTYDDVAGLTGSSDVGKSTFLRQLAIEIARGSNTFLGAKLNTRTCRVVYASTEDGLRATVQAIERQLAGSNLTPEQRNNILFIFESDNLIEKIKEKVLAESIDAIIFDCLGDILDGSPNDAVAVRKEINQLKRLAMHYNCCVLLLHHNVKNSEKSAPDKNKLSGSQAIAAAMRSLLELRLGEKPKERLLTIVKGNYVPAERKNESLVLTLRADTLQYTHGMRVPIASISGDRPVKYDKLQWLARFNELPGDEGIERKIARLKQLYPQEAVPSKTWFLQQKESDGQGDSVDNKGDRPVEPLQNGEVRQPEDQHFEGDRPVV